MREVFLEVLQQDGLALRYARNEKIASSARLHGDRELVKAVIIQNGLSLQYALHRLKKTKALFWRLWSRLVLRVYGTPVDLYGTIWESYMRAAWLTLAARACLQWKVAVEMTSQLRGVRWRFGRTFLPRLC